MELDFDSAAFDLVEPGLPDSQDDNNDQYDTIETNHVTINCQPASSVASPSAGESAAFSTFLSHSTESNNMPNETSASVRGINGTFFISHRPKNIV